MPRPMKTTLSPSIPHIARDRIVQNNQREPGGKSADFGGRGGRKQSPFSRWISIHLRACPLGHNHARALESACTRGALQLPGAFLHPRAVARVAGADEEVGAWLKRNSKPLESWQRPLPVVLRAVADFILEREARLEGKRIVGDKSPSSLLDGQSVRLMHKVYPGCAPDLHHPRWA